MVALVSVIVSGLIAALGLWVSFKNSSQDRSAAAALAREERQQQRLADAYVDLLTHAERVGIWAQSLLPVVNGDPSEPARDVPIVPSLEDETRVTAKVAAFGSEKVADAVSAWTSELVAVRRQVVLIGLRWRAAKEPGREAGSESSNYFTPWNDLEEKFKPKEKSAREQLRRMVAEELQALGDPSLAKQK